MKFFIAVVFACVFLVSCTSEAERIEREIDLANYCSTALDCSLVGSKCPFGCYIYVHSSEAERIGALVESYESACVYSCIACEAVACVQNKCMPVCQ